MLTSSTSILFIQGELDKNDKVRKSGYIPGLAILCLEKNPKQRCHRVGTNQTTTGPTCSKLTTSVVNGSLKFTSSDTQIC